MTTITTAATIGATRVLIDEIARESKEHGQDLSIDKLEFNEIVKGVNENLHLRDYFLGLPIEYSLENCIDLATYFVNELLGDESAIPFYTILSAYHYELGEKIASKMYLSHGIKADYPLASLLNRVYSAGWPCDAIASMREELHPKVIAELEENADLII